MNTVNLVLLVSLPRHPYRYAHSIPSFIVLLSFIPRVLYFMFSGKSNSVYHATEESRHYLTVRSVSKIAITQRRRSIGFTTRSVRGC